MVYKVPRCVEPRTVLFLHGTSTERKTTTLKPTHVESGEPMAQKHCRPATFIPLIAR